MRDIESADYKKNIEGWLNQNPGKQFKIRDLAKELDIPHKRLRWLIDNYYLHRVDSQKPTHWMIVLPTDGFPEPLSAEDVPVREGIADIRGVINGRIRSSQKQLRR